MKINIISILVPFASAALLAGCTKTTAPEYSWTTDPDAVIVNASVGTLTRSNPLGDEDAQKKFNPGDVISITQGSTSKKFDYKLDDNGNWVPVKNDEYMVWPSGKKDEFLATYQLGAYNNLVTDQSTLEGLASADYMGSGEQTVSNSGDNQLTLALNRKFALVTVKIVGYNDQYNPETDKISDLKINLFTYYYNTPEAVSPYVRDAQGKEAVSGAEGTIGWTYSAIGLSQKKEGIVFISFKIAGKEETFTGTPYLDAGKSYIFNLTVGKNKIEAGDITVSGWGAEVNLNGDQGEFDADKAPDPVSVSDLRKQLEEWNAANPEDKKELKDLITKELLDECCVGGKLILTGEFDNDNINTSSLGMSEETIKAFAQIAAYVRDNDVTYLDMSGLKGVTSLMNVPVEAEEYNLRFSSVINEGSTVSGAGSKLETFIGSDGVVNIVRAFEKCVDLVSVSGLKNVTNADYAFAGCSKLSKTPDLPKVLSLIHAFSNTSITELTYESVKGLAVNNCGKLTIIDCPNAVKLEENVFAGGMPKLTDIYLKSKHFELVYKTAFDHLKRGQVTLHLDASQKGNIDVAKKEWTPKKSNGDSAVDGGESVPLDLLKAVYCGEEQIISKI